MKKVIFPIAAMLLILSNHINVNAEHQHSENCYVMQEHVHTGNEASGGGCYGEANFHVHSGDTASGGGCYGAVNYHSHSGDATSGGGCYGAANYHVHSGDSVNGGGCYGTPVYHVHEGQENQSVANGCYTVATSVAGTCTYNYWPNGSGAWNAWMVCSNCGTGFVGTVYTGSGACGELHLTRGGTCTSCGVHNGFQWTTAAQSHTYSRTVYTPGCGKTTETVESYSLNCGKTTDTVESYSLSCGKGTDTVEGYSLSCGKTTETVESYSLNCAYRDNPVIKTLICTLGSNEYAELKRSKINIKYKGSYYKEDIIMVEKIVTDKAPAAIGPYSQGIIAGDFFFASGQIPINPATGNIEGADIAAQAELVMKNIGELLKAANVSYGHVVKTSCFLADMNDFAAFNEVYAKYFTGKPARSCVAVKTLPKNVLCEVEVIAYLNAEVFDV